MSADIISMWVQGLVRFSANYLMPFMAIIFFFAILLRVALYIVVKSEHKFVAEFEKRTHRYFAGLLDDGKEKLKSFYSIVDFVLSKTLYEIFKLKRENMRRKLDFISSMGDRVFLLEEGTTRLAKDTLKRVHYLKMNNKEPRLLEISKHVFSANPYFSRLMGMFSRNLINNVLNVLPGLFIIGGMFGTFLGIIEGLPKLGQIDATNAEAAQQVMNAFLVKMAFSMSSSIVGIIFSVAMTIANTTMAPEVIYFDLINRYASSLDLIWNESVDNRIPELKDQKIQVDDLSHTRGLYENDHYLSRRDSLQATAPFVLEEERVQAAVEDNRVFDAFAKVEPDPTSAEEIAQVDSSEEDKDPSDDDGSHWAA